MPKINFNDLEMYYEIHGKGEPLFLTAGYASDHSTWLGMLDGLAKHFQVVMFDNRAVGQTHDSGKAFTIDTLADDVYGLAQALGIQQFHLLGQSMGGAITQTVAHRYPQAVNKIVILNSVAKFNAVSNLALKNLLQMRDLDVSLDYLLDCLLPWVVSSDFLNNPENVKLFKQAAVNNPHPQSTVDQTRQFEAIQSFDATSWVNSITAPTLVIASRDDVLTLPSVSEWLAKQIPNARFETIPGGHASPLEQQKALMELVVSFLQS